MTQTTDRPAQHEVHEVDLAITGMTCELDLPMSTPSSANRRRRNATLLHSFARSWGSDAAIRSPARRPAVSTGERLQEKNRERPNAAT